MASQIPTFLAVTSDDRYYLVRPAATVLDGETVLVWEDISDHGIVLPDQVTVYSIDDLLTIWHERH